MAVVLSGAPLCGDEARLILHSCRIGLSSPFLFAVLGSDMGYVVLLTFVMNSWSDVSHARTALSNDEGNDGSPRFPLQLLSMRVAYCGGIHLCGRHLRHKGRFCNDFSSLLVATLA